MDIYLEDKSPSPEIRKEVERQWKIISRGTVDLLPEDELRAKLAKSIMTNTPLRIKQGFDPTSPDIHLGHTVGLRKLKQLQELGHQIVLIVGDYTASVGDPSGQSVTRPQLSYDQILEHAETYQKQFFRVLDRSQTEVVANGDWFKKLEFLEVIRLAAHYTVARILERDDFSKRMKAEAPISIHELLYPLMQGYDSVAVKADLEIGGTDQKFNLLVGRTIQEAYGLKPQCILTMPILVGTDGSMKMSKSLGNYIGIEDSPREMYGKTMSIPDDQIFNYFELATDVDQAKLDEIKQQLKGGEVNPVLLKRELAECLVDMYHPTGSGQAAGEEFSRMFRDQKLPDDMPEAGPDDLRAVQLDPDRIYLVHLLTKMGLVKSGGEARKLIAAGSVKIGGEKVTDIDHEFKLVGEMVIKVGKRRFLRLNP